MAKTLREKGTTNLGKEQQRALEGVPVLPPQPLECTQKITRSQLKKYLFRERAGAELDEHGKQIREHIARGCDACQQHINEIEAEEPFLRGEEQEQPVITIETVRKLPDEALRREALAAEVSRRLAAILAAPSASFSFDDLFRMNAKIRTVSDTEKRKTIAAEVANACNARWKRVQTGTELNAEIEAAAGILYSRIRKPEGTSEGNQLSITELQLSSAEKACEFLLYMMTGTWFLHPEGESTWDVTDSDSASGASPVAADGSSTPPVLTVVFALDVLRQALRNYPLLEGAEQPGPERV